MKLALSMLCENPLRKTGLTTLFDEFVAHGLKLYPDVSWLVFAGPRQDWRMVDPRVEVVRDFPANDELRRRLIADHWHVPGVARSRGADVLITVGFVPLRRCLPTVMHLFSLQHLRRDNRVGWARRCYRVWMMKQSWPKADLIITNSDFAVQQVLSVYPDLSPRLIKSYEGLQHELFHPQAGPDEPAQLAAQLGVSPGYVLWVSNFYPYKQADLLLQAYAQLDPDLRRRHPLVMVGGDWEGQVAATRALAARLGITGTVKWCGWIPDALLPALYRQAQAFCLASREETFGRCVAEAMACGTPCLVNHIPIMHEVTGGAALLVDFTCREAVAGALRRLIEDAGLRARLRREGIANVRRFDFDKLTSERVDAIGRMLSGRRPA